MITREQEQCELSYIQHLRRSADKRLKTAVAGLVVSGLFFSLAISADEDTRKASVDLKSDPAHAEALKFEDYSQILLQARALLVTNNGKPFDPERISGVRARLGEVIASLGDEGDIDDKLLVAYTALPEAGEEVNPKGYPEISGELGEIHQQITTRRDALFAKVPLELRNKPGNKAYASSSLILASALIGAVSLFYCILGGIDLRESFRRIKS